MTEHENRIKAYGFRRHGQPDQVLEVVDLPKPQPGPRDLLVRVVAAATNPVCAPPPPLASPSLADCALWLVLTHARVVRRHQVDVKVIAGNKGSTDADAPRIPGYDGSGVVEAVGADATLFKVGDEVYFAGTRSDPTLPLHLESALSWL
jgi:NADPH:quinone reductase-like Zn-dependent oxidoreductase